MITRLFFAARRVDMTTEACLAHWAGTHSQIGARLPGVRAYVQNHGVLAEGRFLLPYPGFDILAELDWDDLAAMDAAIDSPVHQVDSVGDEATFIDIGRTGYAVLTRHVLDEGVPPAGAVKLITLFRRAASASPRALSDAITGGYAMEVRRAGALRHEALITLPDREARPASAVQAADVLWFRNQDDALAWIGSEAESAAAWHLAGLAFGSERLIASPHKIV